MKQLEVIVKDKNTLILSEDGEKGDLINLAELTNVDLTAIEEAIDSGREEVYQKKLHELEMVLKQERENSLEIQRLELSRKYDAEVNTLKETISNYNANKTIEIERIQSTNNLEIERLKGIVAQLEKNNRQVLENQKLELEKAHEMFVAELKKNMQHEIEVRERKVEVLEQTKQQAIENERLTLEQKYAAEITALKEQLAELLASNEIALVKKEKEYEEELNKLRLQHSEEINKKNEVINQKDMLYQELQNRKAALNVKMIGEGLETWCNNEMISYMQNGFLNCKWSKDNQVVKDEGEATGSKADYIFKIYASEECNENELLASVCLEMKDENPNSIHKKKNADYLSALHKNRVKKGCKYAILVSNLELDNPNDLPILKVRDYEDMYIVRPAYMVVLLNMLVSLTTNFKELLLEAKREELEIKAKIDILNEFERLKKSYLEDKLTQLEKNVNEIKKQSAVVIGAAEKINGYCNDIINKYLGEIQIKLERFQINIEKEYRKYDKNNK